MRPPALAVAADQRGADRGVHLGDVGRRRDLAGADRPDRLVGDDQLALLPVVGQRAGEHGASTTSTWSPARALGLALADADDGDEARGQRRLGLGADLGIALALVGAALAMADDDAAARPPP